MHPSHVCLLSFLYKPSLITIVTYGFESCEVLEVPDLFEARNLNMASFSQR
jgi:hypothetical protein